jgi:hypothetical protein
MRKLISVSLVAALCLTLQVFSGASHGLGGIEGPLRDGDAEAFTVSAGAGTHTLTLISFKKRVSGVLVTELDGSTYQPEYDLDPNNQICFSELPDLPNGQYKLEFKVGQLEQVFSLDFVIEGKDLTLLLVTNRDPAEGDFEVRAIPLPGALRPTLGE